MCYEMTTGFVITLITLLTFFLFSFLLYLNVPISRLFCASHIPLSFSLPKYFLF